MLGDTQKLLKVFADKNRLRILCLLRERKMCVCELAYVLRVTQPSISRHLKRMKEVGLVAEEQDGFWTNYYLNRSSGEAGSMLSWIEKYLKNDKLIKSDFQRLKTANRKALCCR